MLRIFFRPVSERGSFRLPKESWFAFAGFSRRPPSGPSRLGERIVVGDLSDDLLVETLVSVADRRDRRIAM
jgi:hypothetical protein